MYKGFDARLDQGWWILRTGLGICFRRNRGNFSRQHILSRMAHT